MDTEFRVSVRSLVEFILRSGSIDNRTETGPDPAAMLEGSRLHRRLQASMGLRYRAEVPLKETFRDGGLLLTVEGRADGILTEDDGSVTIDEIKGVYADPDLFREARPLHLAQAKCYAAIYAVQNGLEEISVRVTYGEIGTEKLRRFEDRYPTKELAVWMDGLVQAYFRWVHFLYEHRMERNESAAALAFPYAYRPGQKETAVNVYRAFLRSRNLFIQAPTGVGKTLSVLYPSVKALGEGIAERIFYLTAKTSTRTVAEDTVRLLAQNGLAVKSVTITAKEKACLNGTFDCNPEACPFADGHFDRVNDAVYDLVRSESVINADVIRRYALERRLCPYELSLDVSYWCDAVIGDYNYAFDPHVKLRRYFGEGSISEEHIFLVDEAHNLVGRASEMFSAFIVKEEVLEAKRLLKGRSRSLTKAFDALNKELLRMKRAADDEEYGERLPGEGEPRLIDDIGALVTLVLRAYSALSTFLEKNRKLPERKDLLPFYFSLIDFLNVYEAADTGYRIYQRTGRDGRFSVHIFCVDPAPRLSECLKGVRSAVFFSATFLPVTYYKELLTGDPEEYAVYTDSPFDRKKRLLLIGADVSSKYTRRNPREYGRVAEYILALAGARRGNYLVFFPSYAYLEAVKGAFPETDAVFIEQKQGMTEEERDAFLASFEEDGSVTRIGLCVMGGVFSEGIDLTRERLIGAVIVGTGLPMINTESEIVRRYFDGLGKPGFDYAYRYPGMNKVLQAAGRVIRTDEDRGVILLLDERFRNADYRRLFPKEWSDAEVTALSAVGERAKRFWLSALDDTEC